MRRNTLRFLLKSGFPSRWPLSLAGVLLVSACSSDPSPVALIPKASATSPPSPTWTPTPTRTPSVCPTGTPCLGGSYRACDTPDGPVNVCTCTACIACPEPTCPGGSVPICDVVGAINSCDGVCRCATPTVTPTSAPGRHRVTGNLGSSSFCNGSGSEIGVALEPGPGSTLTDTRGDFAFENVADGVYELRIGSEPFVQPLTVSGRDERISFCLACPETLAIAPRSGPVGTTVAVSGAGCYALHSGRAARIDFDAVEVAITNASQIGDYHTSFVVPQDAAPGPHMVRLFGNPAEIGGNGEMASAQFVVLPAPRNRKRALED